MLKTQNAGKLLQKDLAYNQPSSHFLLNFANSQNFEYDDRCVEGRGLSCRFKTSTACWKGSLPVESVHAYGTTPGAFWGDLHWRNQTVHMVATVAIVTKQQLVVILRGATERA